MARRAVVLTMYRSFMREARDVTRSLSPAAAGDVDGVLRLTDPLDMGAYAPQARPFKYIDALEVTSQPVAEWLFPELRTPVVSNVLTGKDIAAIVRSEFRSRADETDPEALDEHLNMGLEYLRRFASLRTHQSCSTETTTGGVTVSCASTYFPHASDPPRKFAFAYRLRIVNNSEDTVQLLARQWEFTGENGDTVQVPRGSPGVVGQTPVLKPGAAFEYHSSTMMGSPRGTMSGSFQMVRWPNQDGDTAAVAGVGSAASESDERRRMTAEAVAEAAAHGRTVSGGVGDSLGAQAAAASEALGGHASHGMTGTPIPFDALIAETALIGPPPART